MSFFQKKLYKYINYVAPNLASYAEFMDVLGKNLTQGEIEFFHRRIGQERKYQFEAIIAHPKKFKPNWKQLISPHELLTCININSINYDFRSNSFQGLDSFKILGDYRSYVDAWCDHLKLREREVNVQTEPSFHQGNTQSYSLQGRIRGPVRKLWVGHNDLRLTLWKGIGIIDHLSYLHNCLIS
ncbi:MAG: hypothetical protein AABX24_00225 [Nanoarchaeota archaeon]